MSAKALSIIDLQKVYPNKHGKDVHAVDHINMEIAPGEVTIEAQVTVSYAI